MLSEDCVMMALKDYMDNAPIADVVKLQKMLETTDFAKFQEMFEEGLVDAGDKEIIATVETYILQRAGSRMLVDMLKLKFNDLSNAYIEKINRAGINTLRQWDSNLKHAKSLDEVFN